MRTKFTKKAIAGMLLVIVATVVAIQWMHRRMLELRCAENLRQIGVALTQYSHESRGDFPLLAMTPGRITFEVAALYPKFLPDTSVFVCPAHPKRRALLQAASEKPESAIDDESYWYLGYLIMHERSGLAWVNEYEHFVPKLTAIPEANDVWPDCVENAKARQEDWSRVIEKYRSRKGKYPFAYNSCASPQIPERRFYMRLVAGIQRFMEYDVNNVNGAKEMAKVVPIMIERPQLHGNGGHVLFMDGHVEFRTYPGKFPMTVDFIDELCSLDKLENKPCRCTFDANRLYR
ncbi:MAG: H-X9-DG-CTERM domain-containing protein [Candidatus Hydrogenedentales bacterium]|jgi:prepilin-type processing-associated H-X9-DG protein